KQSFALRIPIGGAPPAIIQLARQHVALKRLRPVAGRRMRVGRTRIGKSLTVNDHRDEDQIASEGESRAKRSALRPTATSAASIRNDGVDGARTASGSMKGRIAG